MDYYQNQFVSNSCKTIVLKTTNLFISAFPGKLVFGSISVEHYLKFNFFQFFVFDLLNLYICLVNIIKKISSSSEEDCDGVIVKINPELSYLWSISPKTINEDNQFHVLFTVELKSKLVYQIDLNLDQLNDLINGLSETIIPCLSFKNLERQFFEFVSKQQISEIVHLNGPKATLFLNDFKEEKEIEIDIITQPNLIDIVVYYKELIIIYKKLKSLVRPIESDTRIDAILSVWYQSRYNSPLFTVAFLYIILISVTF